MHSYVTFPARTGRILSRDATVDITLRVNGEERTLKLEPQRTLLEALREGFGFTGTKEACGEGACGACTVVVDGLPVLACMMLAVEQAGRNIETIEGLRREDELHPLQAAWLEEYGAQCGFCSPGMIMSAKGYLESHPDAGEDEVKEALGGNICVCGNYEHILNAVLKGRERMKAGGR